MNKISIFIDFPLKIKYRLIEVLFLSAYYRFLILHKDFSKLSKKLGVYQLEVSREPKESDLIEISLIANTIDMVCKHTLWKSECLVRAFIASYFLRKKHISGTVYLGVARDESGKMIAHAWTKCGTYSVTGGNGDGFVVTGKWGLIYP